MLNDALRNRGRGHIQIGILFVCTGKWCRIRMLHQNRTEELRKLGTHFENLFTNSVYLAEFPLCLKEQWLLQIRLLVIGGRDISNFL